MLRIVIAIVAVFGLATTTQARTLIAVLPPDLAMSKAQLLHEFGELVLQLVPGDRLIVEAARGPEQLAIITPSNDPRASNVAWRKRQLAIAFAPVAHYLSSLPATPPPGDIPSNLRIPDVLGEIGSNIVAALPERRADILLLGSPLYFDQRDGRWAMSDRFYPSDGHLRARLTDTPFGTAGVEKRLSGATLHFCFPGGETSFATKEYEEDVRRIWSLWAIRQSATMGTFSYDLATCMQRFVAGDAQGQPSYALDRDTKIEMLRARTPMAVALPATTARPGEYFLRDDVPISTTPPVKTTGIAWIGLKWTQNCDVDLYARGTPSSSWLFFANGRSPEGLYNKDFRSATGESQFEFIEFTKPIDLTQTEVAINLYEGNLATPPEGVIRVWFDGKVYEAPFKLGSGRGNLGTPPMSGPHWVRVDLRKVVGLPSS